MPLPYTTETVRHVANRVSQVQECLGRQILLENVSSYVAFRDSEFCEWEFLREIAEQADCFILLDINNIYVSAYNHNFDPYDYLAGIPKERVYQFHLAGHTHENDLIIDTHDQPIVDEVWGLYAAAVRRFGYVSTMIERDDNIPPFDELQDELDQARRIAESIHREQVA
jgi:hypothetical protein